MAEQIGGMSFPRRVLPGQVYFVTRRCVQRQFLLKPSKRGNAAFRYIAALAARKTGVSLVWCCVMSNHYHMGVHDPERAIPKFLAELNRMVAKHHNAMYGRFENLWSTDKPSVIPLPTLDDLIDKLVYSLANPAAADLVESAAQWPGVISLPEHLGTSQKVKRPTRYFLPGGKCPEEVDLEYVVPPLARGMRCEEFRERVASALKVAEAKERARRHAAKIRVLGAPEVMRQQHDATPTSYEPRFVRDPHVAAKDTRLRVRLLEGLRQFRERYALCVNQWVAGSRDVLFPAGTYWMVAYHRCRCEGVA